MVGPLEGKWTDTVLLKNAEGGNYTSTYRDFLWDIRKCVQQIMVAVWVLQKSGDRGSLQSW